LQITELYNINGSDPRHASHTALASSTVEGYVQRSLIMYYRPTNDAVYKLINKSL